MTALCHSSVQSSERCGKIRTIDQETDRRKIRTVSDSEKQVKKFFKKEEMTSYVKCCSKFKKIKSENRFNNMDMVGD